MVFQLQRCQTNMRLSFTISLLAAWLVAACAAPVPRTNLTDSRARCMDGTLGAFYHQSSSPENASRWVIFLDGGGECASEAACMANVNTALGSSNYFYPEVWLPYFLSDDCDLNPDFCTWNRVEIPYCSQDLWSGQVTQPNASTWGLYFSGHLIFEAVLNALQASAGLGSATEIVLTGASAGGIGVWINVDYIASRFPAARVSAAPIAGFYFFATWYSGPNATQNGLADFREAAWPSHMALWQSYVNEYCAAGRSNSPPDGVGPWGCLLANYSYPYVKSASFVMEAQTDEVVLTAHDQLPVRRTQSAGDVIAVPCTMQQAKQLCCIHTDRVSYLTAPRRLPSPLLRCRPSGVSKRPSRRSWVHGPPT